VVSAIQELLSFYKFRVICELNEIISINVHVGQTSHLQRITDDDGHDDTIDSNSFTEYDAH